MSFLSEVRKCFKLYCSDRRTPLDTLKTIEFYNLDGA